MSKTRWYNLEKKLPKYQEMVNAVYRGKTTCATYYEDGLWINEENGKPFIPELWARLPKPPKGA